MFFDIFRTLSESGLFDIVEDYHGIHAALYDGIRESVDTEIDLYSSLIQVNARVAELACGTGSLSIPLASRCTYLLAIDRSEDMLSVFRSKPAYQALKGRITIRRGDFCDFSKKEDGIFDLILIPFNSLAPLVSRKEQRNLFRKCAACLGNGGVLAVDLWFPRRRAETAHRSSLIETPDAGKWMMYSQERFPDFKTRSVNMLLISLDRQTKPVLTSFSEYIYRPSEIRALFMNNSFTVKRLPLSHPVVSGEKRRGVYLGYKNA